LPGTVRSHQRMDLARAELEVDAAQDLVAADRGAQVLDPEHALPLSALRAGPLGPRLTARRDTRLAVFRLGHGRSTITASPSARTVETGTGRVAGRVCGSPVSNENVDPCFGHSISRSSSHTSPSESE